MGDNAKLAKKLGVTFPILADPKRTAIRAYGVLDPANDIAWPAIFVLDGDRTVTWRSLTENYKVRPASEEVLSHL